MGGGYRTLPGRGVDIGTLVDFVQTTQPKAQTLEIFGDEAPDGSYHPFHIYSMRQAIEEGFIMDPLANYVSYSEAVEFARTVPDNPDVCERGTCERGTCERGT